MAKRNSTMSPGTCLNCVTTRGNNIRGNVIATDENFGALVIRESNSSGNVHIINLRYLRDMDTLPSASSEVRPYQPVSLPKVRKRLENNLEARRLQVQATGVNVSPQAQQLFNKIQKIYSDTRWDGQVIVVLGDTRISPPYTADSVTGSAKSVERIRKMVAK